MKDGPLEEKYGYVKDGKVFLKAYLDYPDRQIGEVKKTEQEALDYFKNRFLIAETKIDQLENEIETVENKGSYLTKLVQIRNKFTTFDAIGDFVPLLERLDTLQQYLENLIHENQLKNLEIKQALTEDAKKAASIETWEEATDQIQEVKDKWIRTGPVDKKYQELLEKEFQDVLDNFFQRRREHFAKQNQLTMERLAAYEEQVQATKLLLRMSDLDEAYRKAREIRFAWNNIGEVAPKKLFRVNKAYRHFTNLFYDKYNLAKGIEPRVKVDPRILEQQKLLAQTEALLANQPIEIAANQAKILLSKWREIKLPFRLVDKDLSNRFRNACDKIFELSYLHRVIQRKYPAFELKSQDEQVKTQIREMEWLIKREKMDLEIAERQLETSPPSNEDDLKQLTSKVNLQKRKVAMKDIIVNEFKKNLAELE